MKDQFLSYDKSNTICLVAIIRDEERFLDEWLIYHRLLGIDHFFLYDDDESSPLSKFLSCHRNYISVIAWQEMQADKTRHLNQIKAYNHAFNKFIKGFEWVVFLDADEFIVLKQHTTIKEFLKDFEQANSISLNWHIFGHNGFYEDPKRLIITSLNRRMFLPTNEVKTITRVKAISEITSAHYCSLKNGHRVDANNRIYSEELYEGKTEIANINHYQCRSFKRWMKRVERGDVNFNPTFSVLEQRWRYDRELCFERFITDVARDKNEHVDNHMSKYKYDIQEKIIELNCNKRSSVKFTIDSSIKSYLTEVLNFIAFNVKANINCVHAMGLLSGKTGIAIFLFHYSRFTDNAEYAVLADNLINNIYDSIDKDSPIDYADGLAGFGFTIEYLVKECFIKIDTNEILEEVDEFLHYILLSGSIKNSSVNDGIVGLGKYFLSRLQNPFNDFYHLRETANRRVLDQIIDILCFEVKDDDLLSVLEYCIEAYEMSQDKNKVRLFLEVTIPRMEPMLNKYVSTLYLGNINLLKAALIYLKASDVFFNPDYHNKAFEIIKKFEFIKNTCQCNKDSLDTLFLCLQILKRDHNIIFFERTLSLLITIIKTNNDLNLTQANLNPDDISISKGISGIAIGILNILNECNFIV